MNQKGVVQPIGGVNEKIEGFFKVCQAKGLTGEQGVIIPGRNLDNLMLDQEVIEAIDQGKFNLFSIEEIDQALEIMLDQKAEVIHNSVKEKLIEYAELGAEIYADLDSEEVESDAGENNEEDEE
jgi:predicted ATP-dependent protease